MDRNVTVLTPNGRRQNVKVTLNTTLLQVLEEVCEKYGFDSADYCLTHYNNLVGLTQMFRFSGLPNNCLLRMCETEKKRIESDVEICIQTEDGSRLQGQFKSNDNVWNVVEKLMPLESTEYENPVVIYMRQDIKGKDNMLATTLKSLGIIHGKALFRFLNKKEEDLKTQANVYVAPVRKQKDTENNDSNTRLIKKTSIPSTGGFSITKDILHALKKDNKEEEDQTADNNRVEAGENEENTNSAEKKSSKYDWGTGVGRTILGDSAIDININNTTPMEIDEAEMLVEPPIDIIGERKAIFYSLDSTPKSIQDLPDSFFELTVDDLRLVLRDLKKIAQGNDDAPMLTRKLRELEEQKKMLNKIGQYKTCVIRIQFPDRFVLQGMFKPIESVQDVKNFVRKFLVNENADFYLFQIPPKTILSETNTLLELDFVPTALIHFGCEETEGISDLEYIRPEFKKRLTTAEGALFAANKYRKSNRKPLINYGDGENSENSQSEPLVPNEYDPLPGPSTGAIPKRPRQ